EPSGRSRGGCRKGMAMTSELVGRRRPSWRGAAWLLAALVAACATPGGQATGKVPVRLASAGSGDEMPALRMTPFGDYLSGWHAQYQHDYGAAARFFGSALASDPSDFELM